MKKNNSLLFAWGIFLAVFGVFFCIVEALNYCRHDREKDYQCKILINENSYVQNDADAEKNIASGEDVKTIGSSSLYEHTQYGLLPKISPDGIRVLDAYSAKYDHIEGKKVVRVAVVLQCGGCDNFHEEIKKFGKYKVTFIAPHYLPNISSIAELIHESGHELFLQLPTQSALEINKQNSGLSPMLANANVDDTIAKLNRALSSTKYSIGIANVHKTLFTKSKRDMSVIFEELSKRGMAFLEVDKLDADVTADSSNVGVVDQCVVYEDTSSLSKLTDTSCVIVDFNKLQVFLDGIEKNTILAPVSSVIPHVSI